MREGSLPWVASRGAQRVEGPATEPRFAKRDGRRAEALPTDGGADHEEAEAQEGQVGRRDINRGLTTPDRFPRGPRP